MILISHRGNIDGAIPERENSPDYIMEAIRQGYDVEVDVWFVDGKFRLGHDEPQYNIPISLFEDYHRKLWVHCKNPQALFKWGELDPIGIHVNYFWHQEDDYALTSKGYIWTFPGKFLSYNSIAVMPELVDNQDLNNCLGVCSDKIKDYR